MAKADLKKQAAELIRSNRYSKLITFGTDGAPHGRIMTNLPLGNDMVIWFATGLSTSKIKDIRKNPTVSVFVDDPNDQRNASIIGKAEIVTDSKLRKKFWQEAFGFFFPGGLRAPDRQRGAHQDRHHRKADQQRRHRVAAFAALTR